MTRRWGLVQPQSLPLSRGVTVALIRRETPVPHWHAVTQGLSKFGVELSFRVDAAHWPEGLPASVLEAFGVAAERVRQGAVADGQVVSLPAPVGDDDSGLRALIFTVDAELGTVDSPGGPVCFLEGTPATLDEAVLIREWNPGAFVEVLRQAYPMGGRFLDRPSALLSPRARTVIEARTAREGSALERLQVEGSAVAQKGRRITWRMDEATAQAFLGLLKGRTGHQRDFVLASEGATVEVRPGGTAAAAVSEGTLRLTLPPAVCLKVRSMMRAEVGSYAVEALPHLHFEVRQAVRRG